MIINVPFEIGEQVYFAKLNGLAKVYTLEVGNVFGYSIFSKKGQLDIRINFKHNSVPVEFTSKDKGEVEKLVSEMNEKLKIELGL